MPHVLATGKLPTELLTRLLADLVVPPGVRLAPAVGEDACAIDVPAGVLVAAADPITLTGAGVGAHAVVVNANDVAVMGVRPQWFLATVLLPPGTTDDDVVALFDGMAAALGRVGAALVGGHTEVTPAVRQPVVAGQMLGLAADGRFVTTAGARPGDVVVQIGAVPVEGAAVLAAGADRRLAGVDARVRAAAAGALDDPGISVVEGALAAAALGATALHDPTEGGLASGLHEVAAAAGVGIVVDRDAVAWFEPGLALCAAVGLDAWATLASGAAIATFPAPVASRAIAELAAAGHVVAELGVVTDGAGVLDTGGTPIPWPARDELARLTEEEWR